MESGQFCKVSVIVPVYRVEGYIDRCIKSLLKQTLENIEILCICEKEDSSYQKLLSYEKKDNRVIVIEKKNTGVSSARNAGIKAAKGKYIAFVDADDWIERYALELLYSTAERYSAQIISYGIWPTIEPRNEKRSIFACTSVRNVLYHNNGMKALFYEHGSKPYVINKFYRTKFLLDNNIVFDESIDIGEDQLLQFEAFGSAGTICFIKDKLYHYEMGRKESAMNTSERKQTLSDKNFRLLQTIMNQKKELYGHKYDKEYTLWILQDYGGEVNRKTQHIADDALKRIRTIQGYLREMSAEKHICDLPMEYRYLCKRFLSECDPETNYEYMRMPYRELEYYMARQTSGLYTKISVPERHFYILRKLHELFAFHEFRHWMIVVPERMIQRYKIYKARRSRITDK